MLIVAEQARAAAKAVETVGLACNAIGAVLLGVEAVTLPRIERLHDWLAIRGRSFFRTINPDITWVDEPDTRGRLRGLVGDALGLVTLLGVMLGVGVGVIVLVRYLFLDQAPLHRPGYIALLAYPAALVAGLTLTAVVMGTEATLDAVLWLIQLIDRRTPDGSVGVLGVVLLVVGFGLEVAATWW